MKRRNFLSTVAGIIAAPFVAKKVAAASEEIIDDRYGWELVHRRTNGKLETFSRPKPAPLSKRVLYQEWRNDGSMHVHAVRPIPKPGSFIVEITQDWSTCRL